MLWSLCLNFCHERPADHASGLLCNEKEHVLALVHVLDLAQVYRLLELGKREGLPKDKLLLILVELRLLNCRQ